MNDGHFLLKPFALFFCLRAWYVVGYHGQLDEIRTFKLNRFAEMQPTTHVYEIPKSFTLAKHLGNAWRMIRGDKSYDLELLFEPAFAETISDTAWHPTQAFFNLPDGSLKFTCTVDGRGEDGRAGIACYQRRMQAGLDHCRGRRPGWQRVAASGGLERVPVINSISSVTGRLKTRQWFSMSYIRSRIFFDAR